ncbi:MAG: MBL fold metallo-hydrolase [Actinobacteria bacterium]|nr:MBL fold metallo-hydrolase [Actinomycetota bacterium]
MRRLPLPALGPSARPRLAAALLALAVLLVVGRAASGWLGAPGLRPLPSGTLELTMLDVGQGDGLLARMAGRAMLIDSGPSPEVAERIIVARLAAAGVRHLDYLVLTHADADHIGGAPAVLRAVSVGEIVVGDPAVDHPVQREVFRLARERSIPVRTVARGDVLPWHPAVYVRVLNPGGAAVERSNNDRSVALLLSLGEADVLLTGDMEAAAEGDLLAAAGRLEADVLKVAHHGSASSTSASFLAAVQPQVALASAGRDNPFSHPHDETLQRLLAQHVAIFRTDLAGNVTVRTDGVAIEVALQRG